MRTLLNLLCLLLFRDRAPMCEDPIESALFIIIIRTSTDGARTLLNLLCLL